MSARVPKLSKIKKLNQIEEKKKANRKYFNWLIVASVSMLYCLYALCWCIYSSFWYLISFSTYNYTLTEEGLYTKELITDISTIGVWERFIKVAEFINSQPVYYNIIIMILLIGIFSFGVYFLFEEVCTVLEYKILTSAWLSFGTFLFLINPILKGLSYILNSIGTIIFIPYVVVAVFVILITIVIIKAKLEEKELNDNVR